MHVLDTDLITLLQHRDSVEARALLRRMGDLPEEEVGTTVINYEEQCRGWLGLVSKAKSLKEQVTAYRRLANHLSDFTQLRVLDFDESAAIEFRRLQSLRLKIGTMDLKIAAVVLAHRAILLTRNLSDFSKVPGLRAEDWTH